MYGDLLFINFVTVDGVDELHNNMNYMMKLYFI
jgi:hypothetical protein